MNSDQEQWFHELYQHYWPLLLRIARRSLRDRDLAEDLVDDVFCKIYPMYSQLASHPNIGGYLTVMLRNLVVNENRRKRYDTELPLEDENIPAADCYHYSLADVLPRQLSPEHRKILVLAFEDGLSMQEIGQVLDKSPSACQMQLRRAKDNCKKFWEK